MYDRRRTSHDRHVDVALGGEEVIWNCFCGGEVMIFVEIINLGEVKLHI